MIHAVFAMPQLRGLFVTGWLLVSLPGVASAAGFRLSFLEDAEVLRDTCALLREHGIAADRVAVFQTLVQAHNAPGNRVDRSRYPQLRGGFYQFASFRDFTNRTAVGFSMTPGDSSLAQNTLMCFDVVSLLLSGAGLDAPEVAADFPAKRFLKWSREGGVMRASWADFQDAVGVLCPAQGYETLVGRARSDAETRLGISLRARRQLAVGGTQSERDLRRVFDQQMQDLRRDGFRFPNDFAVGLAYVVNTREGFIWGDHSCLCFRRGSRYICLEKNGPKGPYVRAEFRSARDVARYLSWDLLLDVGNPETRHAGAAVLVSLNERLVGVFRPVMPK